MRNVLTLIKIAQDWMSHPGSSKFAPMPAQEKYVNDIIRHVQQKSKVTTLQNLRVGHPDTAVRSRARSTLVGMGESPVRPLEPVRSRLKSSYSAKNPVATTPFKGFQSARLQATSKAPGLFKSVARKGKGMLKAFTRMATRGRFG